MKKTLTLRLELHGGFLPEDKAYNVTVWQDGNEPDAIRLQTQQIRAGQKLNVPMAPAGGFVAVFTPLE